MTVRLHKALEGEVPAPVRLRQARQAARDTSRAGFPARPDQDEWLATRLVGARQGPGLLSAGLILGICADIVRPGLHWLTASDVSPGPWPATLSWPANGPGGSPALDCRSLDTLTQQLGRDFRADLERYHPGHRQPESGRRRSPPPGNSGCAPGPATQDWRCKSRMDSRTQECLPVLPVLARSAVAHRDRTAATRKAVLAAPPGGTFTAGRLLPG